MAKSIPTWMQLSEAGWQTPDTYSGAYALIPDTSGVYLLECFKYEDYEQKLIGVCYVGQARSLLRRLSKHEILQKLRCEYEFYVRRWFRLVPIDKLREIERQFIKFYNPPFNILGRRRGF